MMHSFAYHLNAEEQSTFGQDDFPLITVTTILRVLLVNPFLPKGLVNTSGHPKALGYC